MRIDDIAQITGGNFLAKSTNSEISILTFDSRRSSGSSEELFIALKGSKNDGHSYLKALHDQGVRNFIVSEAIESGNFIESNIIQVHDSLNALQKIAAFHRSKFSIPVIGITGSNGKTIIKEWLSTLLGQHWQVIKSPKSFNSQIGVPLSVWQMNPSNEVAIFEAGVSRSGEMKNLQPIIRPDIGVFANIGSAHAEGFKSMEDKVEEKAHLFIDCHTIICRKSHALIEQALYKRCEGKIITWEIDDHSADVNFQKITNGYQIAWGNTSLNLTIPLTNPYDLENIIHGIVVALVLEVPVSKIQAALYKIKSVPMRLELKRGVNNTYILDDSYNNDLLGLSIALDYLLLQPKKEKKTVVLSDILQSGKEHSLLYHEVNDLLMKNEVTRLIGVGKQITQAAKYFKMETEFFPSTDSLLQAGIHFQDEMILVKGARDFNLEKVVAFLEEKSHGTVMEVNFESIVHNLNCYRKLLKPQTKLMTMVKAFAYGAGINEIAHLLEYHQADYLGVAYLDEAVELRKKGIKLPIMIMNPEAKSFALLETFDLEPEIYSLKMLQQYLESTERPPGIHLKIETGMHRLGFDSSDIGDLKSILKSNRQLKVKGIFSHLSSADDPTQDEYTRRQLQIFEAITSEIISVLDDQPLRHVLNSAGMARWADYQYDMVRLGIGLYGHDSSGVMDDLHPIATLKTKISQLKTVKKGDTIGYGRKGVVQRKSVIATLAIGYADGYSRFFSNGNAYVLIAGKEAPTIGNVCMDMTMVDVTGINVKEGDEAVIFGVKPSIEDLAAWAQTIPYEILTNVSQRVKRVFVSE